MFNFVNKDDPNYRPNYGSTYIKRQLDVLAGVIPLEDVRINDQAILVNNYRRTMQLHHHQKGHQDLLASFRMKYKSNSLLLDQNPLDLLSPLHNLGSSNG